MDLQLRLVELELSFSVLINQPLSIYVTHLELLVLELLICCYPLSDESLGFQQSYAKRGCKCDAATHQEPDVSVLPDGLAWKSLPAVKLV